MEVRIVEEPDGVLLVATIREPPELAEVVIRREQKKVLEIGDVEVGDESVSGRKKRPRSSSTARG